MYKIHSEFSFANGFMRANNVVRRVASWIIRVPSQHSKKLSFMVLQYNMTESGPFLRVGKEPLARKRY